MRKSAGRAGVDAAAILAEINRAHRLDLTLTARTSDGVQAGAWLVTDGRGSSAVLKVHQPGRGPDVVSLASIVKDLRMRGYPTPAWLAAGVTSTGWSFHVQELAPGVPSYPLTTAKAALLLDVLELHAGLDPATHLDRSADVLRAARDDSPGGFRHDVRSLGNDGNGLIRTYDALLEPYGDVRLAGGDLVHGDFNTCNVLLHDGRVSAVIDLDDLGSGSRVIDYACLLREAYVAPYDDAVKRMLLQAALEVAGPGPLALCTAATAFFIVGFKRRFQPELVAETVTNLHLLARHLAVHR